MLYESNASCDCKGALKLRRHCCARLEEIQNEKHVEHRETDCQDDADSTNDSLYSSMVGQNRRGHDDQKSEQRDQQHTAHCADNTKPPSVIGEPEWQNAHGEVDEREYDEYYAEQISSPGQVLVGGHSTSWCEVRATYSQTERATTLCSAVVAVSRVVSDVS